MWNLCLLSAEVNAYADKQPAEVQTPSEEGK